jgi:hypothetical protein
MRVKEVSVFRERGLHCLSSAEPQVGGVARLPDTIKTNVRSQSSQERKADTMKTDILGKFPAVEPQKPAAADPSAGTGPRLFIGLDVHTDSIAVSVAPSDFTEVRRYGIIGGA